MCFLDDYTPWKRIIENYGWETTFLLGWSIFRVSRKKKNKTTSGTQKWRVERSCSSTEGWLSGSMLVFGFINRDHYQKIYDLLLRIFQHTPGTYPRIPDQTVYVSEFLSFGGLRIPGVCETRVCWGFLRLLYAFVEDHQPYEFRQSSYWVPSSKVPF